MKLPINIESLLASRSVEWERLEFKAGWNPKAVLHTMCAFANDFHNLGGGYIIIGVREENGRPVLPPAGLPAKQLDTIQKEIVELGYRIVPYYHPIIAPFEVDGRHILVLWASGGQTRPYKAPVSLAKDKREFRFLSRRYRNRRVGEFLKELEMTEGRGTGIPKILREIRRNGSPEPIFHTDDNRSFFLVEFPVHPVFAEALKKKDAMEATTEVTTEVTAEVKRLLNVITGDHSRAELQKMLRLKNVEHFRKAYLLPAINAGLVEMTRPEKPKSRLQKYRLTAIGLTLQKIHAI